MSDPLRTYRRVLLPPGHPQLEAQLRRWERIGPSVHAYIQCHLLLLQLEVLAAFGERVGSHNDAMGQAMEAVLAALYPDPEATPEPDDAATDPVRLQPAATLDEAQVEDDPEPSGLTDDDDDLDQYLIVEDAP